MPEAILHLEGVTKRYGPSIVPVDHLTLTISRGEFFTFLQATGALKRSLIVFTSDHGEGLGDHDESTHGYFVYQSTIQVPLIIQWADTSKRREYPSACSRPGPTGSTGPGCCISSGCRGRGSSWLDVLVPGEPRSCFRP